jgi:hypothetical protein
MSKTDEILDSTKDILEAANDLLDAIDESGVEPPAEWVTEVEKLEAVVLQHYGINIEDL